MRQRLRPFPVPAFAALALSLSLCCGWSPPAAASPLLQDDDSRERRRTPVVDVFEQRRSAVVNISATQFTTVRDRFGFFDDDLFERFFDLPMNPGRRVQQTSVGSGFVLHEDGYIVTNAHVVAHTADRSVTLGDGREFPAEIIAVDVDSDLAILRIEADASLPTLPLGRSDDLMVGETVIAIGNPFGFQHTVTAGVISALERTILITERIQFEGLIQTDAGINPGNSGGPLFNVLGELIGINTAIRHDAENIGFAIPVDQLRRRLPDLLSIERRDRVVTGMVVSGDDRVRIQRIEPGSAAADAGLRQGDSIIAIEGEPVGDVVDFHIALLGCHPGDQVDVQFARGGERIATTFEIRQRPAPDAEALARERLGVSIEEVSFEEGSRLIRVVEVERDGPAYSIDVRAGDYLVAINGAPAATLEALGLLLEPLQRSDVIAITFARISRNFRQQNTVQLRVN